MEEKQQKRNRNIGLISSASIHGLLLLLFLFSMAWRAPDPPLPEFGIELNFGVDQEGSGDIQPDTPPVTDAQDDPQEVSSEAVEEQKEESNETKQEVIASEQESVVTLKEEKETLKNAEKPKETEKPKAEYKKDESQEKQSDNKDNQPLSHGDDSKKQGDKGNPEGTLDAKALYGKQGGGAGGDGMVLSMSGWAWADQPRIPSLPDNEDGRVVFEIECDEDGEIVGITTIERGLSAKAEQLLKEEIRKNSLVRTSGGQTPSRSKGRVVFVLKTK